MGLRKSALGLAAASATEYGLQLVIPMVLVRTLDPSTFGHYRFLWLMAGTALAWVPLFIPQTLFYFLPRYKERSSALVTNALMYLLVTGAVVGLLSSNLNPLLPEVALRLDVESQHLSSVFLGLWVAVSLFDVLPTAIGMSHVQARTTAILALLRSALLVAAALLAPTLVWITLALVCVVVFKLLALLIFIRRNPALTPMRLDLGLLRMQMVYAAPFALGNALFLMRVQADQWIVASAVNTATYAVFSVASVLGPIGTLIRQPLHNAMMPKLNAAYASGRLQDAASLIGKANSATSLILVPVVGGLFASSHELVSFVYTRGYADAAPVMQVYLIGMLANSFAVGHVMPALNLGKFATINNAICLACSIAISYVGLKELGLYGAALGSVAMLYVGELWSGFRVSRVLGGSWHQLLQCSSLYRSFIALGLSVAAAMVSGSFLVGSLPAIIVIKSLVFSIIYIPVFILLGGRSDLQAILGKQSGVAADVGV
jgi:O-antigen/teichoic acid export membrane protein